MDPEKVTIHHISDNSSDLYYHSGWDYTYDSDNFIFNGKTAEQWEEEIRKERLEQQKKEEALAKKIDSFFNKEE